MIGFSIFSILPPVDAFTISKSSQQGIVEEVLSENNMMENNTVQPNGNIPNEDKKVITEVMEYLNRMGYVEELEWLPKDFNYYEDFSKTFGFQEYYSKPDQNEFVYVTLEPNTSISITNYDAFIVSSVYSNPHGKTDDENVITFESQGEDYTLNKEALGEGFYFTVYNEQKEEVIRFQTEEIVERFYDYHTTKEFLPVEGYLYFENETRASIENDCSHVNIDKMSE